MVEQSSLTKFQISEERLEHQIKPKFSIFGQDEAIRESERCLYCYDAPCIKACPTGIDIPTFIHKIAANNDISAARTILKSNILGASCARVCPVEELCAGACVYQHRDEEPIAIGRLQEYAVRSGLEKRENLLSVDDLEVEINEESAKASVALIGSGPASLSTAGYLALMGHECIIYEQAELPGGLNTNGIAPYKQYAEESLAEINWLMTLGKVQIKTSTQVSFSKKVLEKPDFGHISFHDLQKDFDAVFIGCGIGEDRLISTKQRSIKGIFGATDFIAQLKTSPNMKLKGVNSAIVLGAGNTALDAAHELLLLGVSRVSMVYRKAKTQMSGYKHELEAAQKSGLHFLENLEFVDFEVKSGELVSVQLLNKVSKKKENHAADLVLVAIGQEKLKAELSDLESLELDDFGRILIDKLSRETTMIDVYAGGDAVNGGAEVVNAVEDGKLAAYAIHRKRQLQYYNRQ